VPKKIIVGYDGSSFSQAALAWALDEAARTAAPVELVYADEWQVLAPAARLVPARDADSGGLVTDIVSSTLDQAVAKAKKIQPMVAVTATTVHAHAPEALTDLSRRARLVVIGTRGHSAVGGLLGSVSTAVSAHAHCPVVVVRGEAIAAGPVVAGVDGSALAQSVLAFAAEQAAARRAPLRVIRTWPPVTGLWEETAMVTHTVTDEERKPFDTLVAGVREAFPGLPAEAEATVAHPAAALTQASAESQLLVVGSRGRGAVRGLLLGSVSQHLLRHSHCAVAVVPHLG
jgi:nucleotide-binding universal stress UspA family protein